MRIQRNRSNRPGRRPHGRAPEAGIRPSRLPALCPARLPARCLSVMTQRTEVPDNGCTAPEGFLLPTVRFAPPPPPPAAPPPHDPPSHDHPPPDQHDDDHDGVAQRRVPRGRGEPPRLA